MAVVATLLALTVAAVPPGEAQDTSEEWVPEQAPLMTRWADNVSPAQVKKRPYPRPAMRRSHSQWQTLNGLWDYAIAGAGREEPPGSYDGDILVPFAVESALSGVMERVGADRALWYRRTFETPDGWSEGERLLLHFGAVDWDATVYLNGEQVGRHKGGFDPFTIDITDALREGDRQELMLRVHDPTDVGNQPRGKQVKEPGGIYYTPVTGIWQTVWLEPVPAASIRDLRVTPDLEGQTLTVSAEGRRTSGGNYQLEAVARERGGGAVVGRASNTLGEDVTLSIDDPRAWHPDDPYLYDLEVRLTRGGEAVDAVDSYFGMRDIGIAEGPDGESRIMLNGEFVFQVGPLDQGYWPDGLYTAPTDEALAYDLKATKRMGFNTSRKHVKVEPRRWYYLADSLGVLVWQDMPNADNETPESKRQFERELEELVDDFYNYPSIIAWVIFNEGWGQFDAVRLTNKTEAQDPSRLAVDVSGWQTQGAGDVIDVHRYQGPVEVPPQGGRASLVGEFGGLGLPIESHLWKEGSNWGYEGTFETRAGFLEAYEQRMKRLWHSKETAHMSGGIYTQITDVEVEVNGLMTYDRDITKASQQRLAAVNQGRTPYIRPEERRFIGEAQVELENWADGTTIRYTLDGHTPTTDSDPYDGPLTIREATTVKARAFRGDTPVSPVASARFEPSEGLAAASVSKENLEPGLRYGYFDQRAAQNAPFHQHWPLRRYMEQGDRLEPAKSGSVENISLAPRERDSLYAFNYEGYLRVPQTGNYTFTIHADDGVSLLISGEEITDRAGQSPGMTVNRAQVPLQEGWQDFTLRHFQAYGPATLEVYMQGPGMEKQRIPASMFFHDMPPASATQPPGGE